MLILPILPNVPLWVDNPSMHLPDGFLSLPISLFCWLVTIALLIVAIQRTKIELGERQVPLMGIMAALIFAAQMINFPVAGGTSGHLLGGVLASVVLGPWAGMVVMATVIGVQGLLFQDGGLLVMGANILNMGLLSSLVGYGLYRTVLGQSRAVQIAVIGGAAWLSVMTGALATALQLWLSGTSPLTIVIPAMLGIHAFIGIGEAFITVAAITFIRQTRPDLLETGATTAQGGRGWMVGGLAVTALVLILSPWASADPDGLERVAEDWHFLARGISAPYQIFPDYTLPFLGETAFSTVMAGTVGAIVVAIVVMLMARLLQKLTKAPTVFNP